MSKDIIRELRLRRLLGLVSDSEGLSALSRGLATERNKKAGVYIGLDPTSDGLHVGNLAAICTLKTFQRCGFQTFAIVGGATGMIGDPSGRNTERALLDLNTVSENCNGIKRDLMRVLGPETTIFNNADWLGNISAIDLLRDAGKRFSVRTMLNRQSVRSRLEKDDGITFTEFAYQLLQAYDFLHLYNNHSVKVQIGGSDQWGNITGGLDLIRKTNSEISELSGASDVQRSGVSADFENASCEKPESSLAFGVTTPLLVDKVGNKFGKSAGNAVWLSPDKTSDYRFYQFFLNIADEVVEDYLFKLTEVPEIEIRSTMKEHENQPEERLAQKLLAENVFLSVRSQSGLDRVKKASKILFAHDASLQAEDMLNLDAPTANLNLSEFFDRPVHHLAASTGILSSKGEAKRVIEAKGLYLNNQLVERNQVLNSSDVVDGKVLMLRVGKKNHIVVRNSD